MYFDCIFCTQKILVVNGCIKGKLKIQVLLIKKKYNEMSFVHDLKSFISTLPTLPILERCKISTKISPTLPTLPWVLVISIYKEKYFSTLPTLPIIKRSKISSKISPTLPTLPTLLTV